MHAPITTRTVLCHGCFDVLHVGHIRHLREARALGDRLVVSITDDAHVDKGPGRPIHTAQHRAEMLRALDCVDEVLINRDGNAEALIEHIKPAVYVKGVDYVKSDNPSLKREIAAVEAVGGRFHITQTEKFSSTSIIAGMRLSDEAHAYIESARARGFLDQIKAAFAKADTLSIAFVGETIIDEYRYVKPLAKPSKEFIQATVEAGKATEQFNGGVMAAALHGDWPRTSVLTQLDRPIRKMRYVDADFNRKLFEVYSSDRVVLNEQQRMHFMSRLSARAAESDVVVVFDFGHGLIRAPELEMLRAAKFLAVNAQTNAGNHGFNSVTKYIAPHLITVDMPEAQLACRQQWTTDSDVLIPALRSRTGAANIVITHGRHGCYCPQHIPALATRAVDTIGAGDAFLAVTAPLVSAGLDLEAAALVGNIAGALKTDIVGHRTHVTRAKLMDMVEGLLR